MRQFLRPHPDSCCFAAAHIEVAVARLRTDSLVLSYIVTGKMSDVRLPPVMAAARSDELWRHTASRHLSALGAGITIQLCAFDNGRHIG
jgi:hypothetical protein